MIYQLHREEAPRIWIGASRHNQASVRGMANAGFRWVVDVAYRRFYRLRWMWVKPSPSAPHSLISAAYRIMLNHHERRIGSLVIGYI